MGAAWWNNEGFPIFVRWTTEKKVNMPKRPPGFVEETSAQCPTKRARVATMMAEGAQPAPPVAARPLLSFRSIRDARRHLDGLPDEARAAAIVTCGAWAWADTIQRWFPKFHVWSSFAAFERSYMARVQRLHDPVQPVNGECEYIMSPHEVNVKPYYDLEMYLEDEGAADLSLIGRLREAVKELYGAESEVAFADNSRWVDKGGKRQWKQSIHAVAINIKTTVADVRWSALRLLEDSKLPIDTSVYKDGPQAFRLCGSFKWDDKGRVPMRLLLGESPPNLTLEDLMISRFPEGHVVLERRAAGLEDVDTRPVPARAKRQGKEPHVHVRATAGQDPLLAQLQALVGDPRIFGVVQPRTDAQRQGSAVYPVRHRRTCRVSENVHHASNNGYLVVRPGGEVVYRCHSDKCKGSVSLGVMAVAVDTTPPRRTTFFAYDRVVDGAVFCQDHVPGPAERCRVITAPPGRGKSQQIVQTMLDALRRDAATRFVYVIPRRTLACCTKWRLQTALREMVDPAQVAVYTEPNAFRAQVLIIQYESLRRIPLEGADAYFDVLVVDETRSVINQMTCLETNRHHIRHNYERLRSLAAHSAYAMFCDADHEVDGACAELVYSVFPRGAVFAERYTHVEPRTVRLMGHAAWLVQIMGDLKKAKKVGIVLGTPSAGEFILQSAKDAVPDLKYKFYFGKGDDKERNEDLQNVQESWAEAQLVMFTATITQGVDCQLEFDRCYLHGHSRGPSPRDAMQQIARFRRVRDTTIYATLDAPPPPDDFVPATHESTLARFKRDYAVIADEFHMLMSFSQTLVGRSIESVPDVFTSMLAHSRTEDLNKTMDYQRSFALMCQYRGYVLRDVRAFNDERVVIRSQADTTLKKAAFELILQGVVPNEAAVKAGFASAADKEGVAIYHCVKHFGDPMTFEQFEEIDAHTREIRMLAMATKLTEEQLRHRDAATFAACEWIEVCPVESGVIRRTRHMLAKLGCGSLDPATVRQTKFTKADIDGLSKDLDELLSLSTLRSQARAKSTKGTLAGVLKRVFGLHVVTTRRRAGKRTKQTEFSLDYLHLKAWDKSVYEVAQLYEFKPQTKDVFDFDLLS